MCDTRIEHHVRSPKIETKFTKYPKTVLDAVETFMYARQQMAADNPNA